MIYWGLSKILRRHFCIPSHTPPGEFHGVSWSISWVFDEDMNAYCISIYIYYMTNNIHDTWVCLNMFRHLFYTQCFAMLMSKIMTNQYKSQDVGVTHIQTQPSGSVGITCHAWIVIFANLLGLTWHVWKRTVTGGWWGLHLTWFNQHAQQDINRYMHNFC